MCNRSLALSVAVAACLAGLSGCGSRSTVFTATPSIAPADMVARGAADWLRDVSKLEATALVTTYDADGASHVSAQFLKINVDSGKLRATCNVPGGSWRALVSLGSWDFRDPFGLWSVRTRGDAELTDAQTEQIVQTLRLILHRIRGPINLLEGDERVIALEAMPTGAHGMTRMRVDGRPSLAAAYFFERAGGQLRMITQGGYEPGAIGTVTTYVTGHAADGVVVPTQMDVVELGIDNLMGQRKVLSVRLSDVKLR